MESQGRLNPAELFWELWPVGEIEERLCWEIACARLRIFNSYRRIKRWLRIRRKG